MAAEKILAPATLAGLRSAPDLPGCPDAHDFALAVLAFHSRDLAALAAAWAAYTDEIMNDLSTINLLTSLCDDAATASQMEMLHRGTCAAIRASATPVGSIYQETPAELGWVEDSAGGTDLAASSAEALAWLVDHAFVEEYTYACDGIIAPGNYARALGASARLAAVAAARGLPTGPMPSPRRWWRLRR